MFCPPLPFIASVLCASLFSLLAEQYTKALADLVAAAARQGINNLPAMAEEEAAPVAQRLLLGPKVCIRVWDMVTWQHLHAGGLHVWLGAAKSSRLGLASRPTHAGPLCRVPREVPGPQRPSFHRPIGGYSGPASRSGRGGACQRTSTFCA